MNIRTNREFFKISMIQNNHTSMWQAWDVYCCLYLFSWRYPIKVQACYCGHTSTVWAAFLRQWPPLKRSVVGSILLSGPSCSLGYFPFQPVVHNWFIKGCGMYCSVYGKVHIKDSLLLIEKSSLCGGSGFPSKKCVNVTIWMTSNNRW